MTPHARPTRTSATSTPSTPSHAPTMRPPSTLTTSENSPASTLCHVMRASSAAASRRLRDLVELSPDDPAHLPRVGLSLIALASQA